MIINTQEVGPLFWEDDRDGEWVSVDDINEIIKELRNNHER